MYWSKYDGKWVLSNAAYKRQFLLDAGATPAGTSTADVNLLTVDALLAQLSGVDVLIDETYSTGTYTWDTFLDDYKLRGVAQLPKVVQDRKVWRLDGLVSATGSLDWFAGAVAEADDVLADIIGAVQGTLGARGTWLRRLADGTPLVQTSVGCSNALAAAALLDVACTAPACTAPTATVDYFAEKVTVLHAQDFTITYFGTYKTVVNRNSNVNEKYLLYQRGTQPPANTSGYKVFAIPLQAVAVEDTAALRFLELVGVHTAVRYMQTQYTTSGCLQALAQRGKVGNLDWADTPLRQSQLAAVEALFTYGASANAKSVACTSASDPGPLRRAEWVKFVAVFFNREAEAQRIFEAVRQQYLFQVQAVMGVTPKPVVARAPLAPPPHRPHSPPPATSLCPNRGRCYMVGSSSRASWPMLCLCTSGILAVAGVVALYEAWLGR